MLAVLLAALGIAHLQSTTRQMRLARVGSLELPIPPGWTRQPDVGEIVGFEAQAQFQDKSGDRRLIVGLLAPGPRRLPRSALARAMVLLLDEDQARTYKRLVGPLAFRAGLSIGLQVSGSGQSGNVTTTHTLAVLTENGLRYWVVCLASGRYPTNLSLDNALLNKICQSAIDHQRRDATADDMRAARLNPHAPPVLPNELLRARVDTTHRPGEPIELVPTTGRPVLQTARVLGTFDLTTEHSDDARTWSVVHSSDAEAALPTAKALSLTVYYVRLGDGQGMLIEVEGIASAQVSPHPWGLPIVTAFAPGPRSGQNAKAELEDAAVRGESLVTAIRQQMPQQIEAGLSYHLFERYGRPVGFGVTRTATDLPGPLPWSSRTWLAATSQLSGRLVEQWSCSVDGLRFWSTRASSVPDAAGAIGWHLACNDAELWLSRLLPDGTQQTVWSAAPPRGYLSPPATCYWPVDWLDAAGSGPTLIWMSKGAPRPQPCLVDVFQSDDSEDAASDGHLQLQIRPLMALDADRLTIDRAGRPVAWYHARGWPQDVENRPLPAVIATTTARTVTRQAVLDVFADVASQLETWEQEHLNED